MSFECKTTHRSIKVAIIGCGLVGKKRIAALPNNCTLKYVFDVVAENAQTASSLVDYPVIVATSLKVILNDPQVDIVIVATTHKDLVPTAMQAVEHKKHVLIEKPGSLDTTYRFSDIVATDSRGAQTFRVEGSCQLNARAKTIKTGPTGGGCTIIVDIAANGKFPEGSAWGYFIFYKPLAKLAAPTGSDKPPAFDGETESGWFKGTASIGSAAPVKFSAKFGDNSSLARAPKMECIRKASGGLYKGDVEVDLMFSLADGTRLYVFMSRSVFTYYGGETQTRERTSVSLYNFTSEDWLERDFEMVSETPPNQAYGDENVGSGSNGLKFDGSGGRFNLVLVERLVETDINGERVERYGDTMTLSGYVTCGWAKNSR